MRNTSEVYLALKGRLNGKSTLEKKHPMIPCLRRPKNSLVGTQFLEWLLKSVSSGSRKRHNDWRRYGELKSLRVLSIAQDVVTESASHKFSLRFSTLVRLWILWHHHCVLTISSLTFTWRTIAPISLISWSWKSKKMVRIDKEARGESKSPWVEPISETSGFDRRWFFSAARFRKNSPERK